MVRPPKVGDKPSSWSSLPAALIGLHRPSGATTEQPPVCPPRGRRGRREGEGKGRVSMIPIAYRRQSLGSSAAAAGDVPALRAPAFDPLVFVTVENGSTACECIVGRGRSLKGARESTGTLDPTVVFPSMSARSRRDNNCTKVVIIPVLRLLNEHVLIQYASS